MYYWKALYYSYIINDVFGDCWKSFNTPYLLRESSSIWVFSLDTFSFAIWYYEIVVVNNNIITLIFKNLDSKNYGPFP